MTSACDALTILRTKNRTHPTWVNRGIYRLLYNPSLYVLAYERLKSKPGNMTRGTDDRTLDGFSLETIQEYYYQLAENVGRLNYARYILLYSLANTLAHKERCTVAKVFRKYGKTIMVNKPSGRAVQFFSAPLTQVKKARPGTEDMDAVPTWRPRTTQTRLLDQCAICGSPALVEMHHVRHIRKRGQALRGFTLYLAALNRKQLPVCRACHQDIHRGKYDGANLASIRERLEARHSVAEGSSS
jgi:Type II intron maturase